MEKWCRYRKSIVFTFSAMKTAWIECCWCYWFLLTSLRDTCSQGRGVWFYVAKHLSKAVTGFSRQKFNYWDFDIPIYFLRIILRSGIIPAFSQYPCFSSLFLPYYWGHLYILPSFSAFFAIPLISLTFFSPLLLISFLSLHAFCSFICPFLSPPCKLSHFYVNRPATSSQQFKLAFYCSKENEPFHLCIKIFLITFNDFF